MKPVTALQVLGALVFLFSSQVLADNVDGQISRVETNIRNIARALSRVDTDKDLRGVDRIIRDAKKSARSVEALAKVAGGNKRATDLVISYNNHVREFIGSLGALGSIKQLQYGADELAEQCVDAIESLEKKVEAILEVGDPDGVSEIKKLAETNEKNAKKWLADAAKADGHIKERVRLAKRFNESRNPWKQVSGTVHGVASSMHRHYAKHHGNAKQECQPLTDGERQTFVRNAITELEDRDQAIAQFSEDVETWFEGTRKVFGLNCAALSELRTAYCINDYEDSSDSIAAGRELADQIATSRGRVVIGKLAPIVREQQKLRKWGQRLLRGGQDDHVQLLLNSMRKRTGGLEAIQNGGAPKGSRHPMIQTWIKYGVDQHKRLENKHSCDVADKAIPGSNKRPDCIDVAACEVIEFKPNNSAAISKGKTQLNLYRILLEGHLEKLVKKQKVGDAYDTSIATGNPSSFGGEAFVKKAWDSDCIDDQGRVFFETLNPVTYKTCEAIPLDCPE